MKRNKIQRVYIISIILIALSSCSSGQSQVENAVKADLKDPDSAKFGSFEMIGNDSVCIEVNAKNQLGGYAGKKAAVLTSSNNQKSWYMEGVEESGFEGCVKNFKENLEDEKLSSHPGGLLYGRESNFSQNINIREAHLSPFSDDTPSLSYTYYAGKLARCKFSIESKIVFAGPCRISADTDGSFDIYERADPGFFVKVLREESYDLEDPSAVGYWNADRGSTHASAKLGYLTQSDACWKNKRAEICVYSSR